MASSCLPNFPKKSTDFYVAILPHKKSVKTGRWEDLLWLRVKGKNTVAQVKNFYTKTAGTQAMFIDGGSVVREDTEIRTLNHLKTDLVVLWTVSAEREVLGETTASRQNAKASAGSAVKREKSDEAAKSTVKAQRDKDRDKTATRFMFGEQPESPPPRIESVKSIVYDCRRTFAGSVFKVAQDGPLPKVTCLDCPDYCHEVPILRFTGLALQDHHNSQDHKTRMQNRLSRTSNLKLLLREIDRNHSPAKFTLLDEKESLKPRIKCSLCPEWVYSLGVEETAISAARYVTLHAESKSHKELPRNARAQELGVSGWMEVKTELLALKSRLPNSVFAVQHQAGRKLPCDVICKDCTEFKLSVTTREGLRQLFSNLSVHCETQKHLTQMALRLQTISDLRAPLARLNRQYPGSGFTLQDLDKFAGPLIKCTACHTWSYKLVALSVPVALTHVESHVESDIHKKVLRIKHGHHANSIDSSDSAPGALSSSNPNGTLTEEHGRKLRIKAHTHYAAFAEQISVAFSQYLGQKTDCKDCSTFFRNVLRVKIPLGNFPYVLEHPSQHSLLKGELRALCEKHPGSSMKFDLKHGWGTASCANCPGFQKPFEYANLESGLRVAREHLTSVQHCKRMEERRERSRPRPQVEPASSSSLASKFQVPNMSESGSSSLKSFNRPSSSDLDSDTRFVAGEMEAYHSAQNLLKRKRDTSVEEAHQVRKHTWPPIRHRRLEYQSSSHGTASSFLARQVQGLKSEYPEDDFAAVSTAIGECFKCLDCDRTMAPGCHETNVRQHLDSKTHKDNVASRQGKRQKRARDLSRCM
ncbi:uncharacterized protein PAC_20105 [Phialocephala subalpina]|uniref:Uncharacterized protein n=1 Tax=Phialocephala subalpina TaxID=576137 RepID=A0A1L7XYV5_9HELO|nr:uncharacterized protein PAC_20105 [Phialocephala subalpina]